MVLTSSDLKPTYPCLLTWPLAAPGGESLSEAQSREGEASWNCRACFHSPACRVSGQRPVSSYHWATSAGSLDILKAPWALLGVFCSVSPTLRHNFPIFWTFDPCPSFGYFLPWRLILVSLHFCWNISSLRCAKPIITCLYGYVLAETPSKGEEQQRLSVCVFLFCFLKRTSSLLPPTIKLVAVLTRQTIATLTTLKTLFSNSSFYMSFKSQNILNEFFHPMQVGSSCYMHLCFWLNILTGLSGGGEAPTQHYCNVPWISISINWQTFAFNNQYIKLYAMLYGSVYHHSKQEIPHPHTDKLLVLSTPPSCHAVCSPTSKKIKLENNMM